MMKHARLAAIAAIAFAGTSLSTPSAFAQSSVEAAIDAWVETLGAADDVDARYAAIEVNGADAVIRNLEIYNPYTSDGVLFDTLNIVGYETLGTSGLSADVISFDRARVRMGDVFTVIVDFQVTDFALPSTGFLFVPQRPYSSVVEMLSLAADASFTNAYIGRIQMAESIAPELPLVTYQNYTINNMADGRIESTSAGPVVMRSPSSDGFVTITVDEIVSQGINFNALIDSFGSTTPATDRPFVTMLEYGAYRNIIADGPDIRVRIDAIELEDFELRRPAQPTINILDQLAANPEMSSAAAEEMSSKMLLDLISPYRFGRLSIQGLDLFSEGFDRFHLGEVYLSDLSIAGLGETGIDDLDIVVGGEGSVRLGRFALGDIVMPPEETLRAAIEAGMAGEDVMSDFSLIPTLGFIEVEGFEFGAQGELPISVARAQLLLDGWLDLAPTDITFSVDGLRAPLSLMPADLQAQLADFGITEIAGSLGAHFGWDESSTVLAIDDFGVALDNIGSIEMGLAVSGITREMLENPEVMERQIANLALNRFSLTAVDEALVSRIFSWAAVGDDRPVDQFRDEFIRGLPFVLAFTFGNDLAQELTPTIQQFLREPGTISVMANPGMPIPLEGLLDLAVRAPNELIELLGLTIETTPAQ